jgi:serine O-acetyltransferase
MSAIHLYRLERRLLLHGVPVLPRVVYFAIFLLFNSAIPPQAEIGRGTNFGYGGMGVIRHKRSKIGPG